LKITLTNQPAILTKKKEIDLYRGIHRSYKGDFNWELITSLQEEHDSAPLTVKEAEEEAAKKALTLARKESKIHP